MATWVLELYKYYSEKLDALHNRDFPLLRINPSNIFSATMYNFRPQMVCYKHLNFGILVFGLCAVTALGNFAIERQVHCPLEHGLS